MEQNAQSISFFIVALLYWIVDEAWVAGVLTECCHLPSSASRTKPDSPEARVTVAPCRSFTKIALM